MNILQNLINKEIFEDIIVNILNLLGNTIDLMTLIYKMRRGGGENTLEIMDTIYKIFFFLQNENNIIIQT